MEALRKSQARMRRDAQVRLYLWVCNSEQITPTHGASDPLITMVLEAPKVHFISFFF